MCGFEDRKIDVCIIEDSTKMLFSAKFNKRDLLLMIYIMARHGVDFWASDDTLGSLFDEAMEMYWWEPRH